MKQDISVSLTMAIKNEYKLLGIFVCISSRRLSTFNIKCILIARLQHINNI